MAAPCGHIDQIRVTQPSESVCEACVAEGSRWVHLRMCLTCGEVGCCDASPKRHARGHFVATGHPLIRSIEPGESWTWCYVDEVAPVKLPS
jgi:uncharacterized UBP type Zn finger protein